MYVPRSRNKRWWVKIENAAPNSHITNRLDQRDLFVAKSGEACEQIVAVTLFTSHKEFDRPAQHFDWDDFS